MAERGALLIAVETFFEAGPPVSYAAADLAALHRALPAAGYDARKCLLVAGARTTKASLESHLARLPKLIGKVDSLLVLVVSRGFSHKGRGYVLCADTITPDLPGTSLLLADLVAAVERTRCPQVTYLLDLDPLEVAGEIAPAGLREEHVRALFDDSAASPALLAAEPGERSYESAQLRQGIWRHHLIEAFTGKVKAGIGPDGRLTATALHAYLADAVPRTLRRAYESTLEQSPRLFGEANAEAVVAELSGLLQSESEPLDPARMRRVLFRSEAPGKVKDLSGYRKTHAVPDRANEWARKYVNRIAAGDIKADLDSVFDMVREEFGYKRKDLDVSAERDGLGFIRTPDFEYTVSLSVNPDSPSEVTWRREIGRLSGPEFVLSSGFQAVFGPMFDRLVFEFAERLDVAAFVDRIEEDPPEGVKLTVASDADAAEVALAGFAGRIAVSAESAIIHGQRGSAASLLEQFLAFLKKFSSGDPPALPLSPCSPGSE